MASLGNDTFWAGNQRYLDNPSTIGNIDSFNEKSSDERFGFSSYNLIKFWNQIIWSSGRNFEFSMGTDTTNYGYDSKEV